ncbi:uncharacterized protein MAL13P1.304-like [Leguminivora glycinivorella]|uniref:uncharacterized protein MAL13P1.304-like n=1 Tax=Leguminivora glycinivorella TaxID=1035111 RepID=UPI0020105C3E|nr:uncharacterized protein MAL13P1.304-like [Leguminivora glycinivorella]
MILLRHVLQVCTLACIPIAIDGHVMLAVNVDDFRNLATQFLPKELADKLTNLVSELSHGKIKEIADNIQRELPEVLTTKSVEITDKDPVESEWTYPYTAKTVPHKRFNTVKNSDSKELLRQVIYNTAGPVYVRDEVEELLTNINSGGKDFYHPEEPNEKEHNIAPIEVTKPLEVIKNSRETPNKMDYTETKLGEWNYMHDIPKELPEIKNIKKGKEDKDINDEDDDADYDKPGKTQDVQYVDETRLLGRIKKKPSQDVKEQDDGTLSNHKEVNIEPKKSNKLLNNFSEESSAVKQHESSEKETHQIPPPMFKQEFIVQSDDDNNEEHNRETTKIPNKEGHKKLGGKSDNNEQLILKNKKRYLDFKVPENSEEYSKRVPLKQISTNRAPHYYEDKSDNDKLKPEVSTIKYKNIKQPVDKHSVTPTDESNEGREDIGKKKSFKISNEENNMHEKVSENKKSNNEHNIDNFDGQNIQENNHKTPPLLRNKPRLQLYHKDSEEDVSTKKEIIEGLRPDSGKGKMQRFSDHVDSFTFKDDQDETHHDNRKIKQKENHDNLGLLKDRSANNEETLSSKRKPQKKTEDNEQYDKFEHGRETNKGYNENRKEKKNHDDMKTYDDRNKFNHQGSTNDKSESNEDFQKKRKRKPQKKIEDNEMHDKYGRETNTGNTENKKQKENHDDMKNYDSRNKFNHQDSIKDMSADSGDLEKKRKKKPLKKIEEHDMYDKFELGHETNNDENNNKEKYHGDTKTNNAKNNFNEHGHNKNKSTSKGMNKRRPQKIIVDENDKYEPDHEINIDDRKQKENRDDTDDTKTVGDKNKFNNQGHKELGRERNIDDRKHKENRDDAKTVGEKFNNQGHNKELSRERNIDDRKRKEHRDDTEEVGEKNKFKNPGHNKELGRERHIDDRKKKENRDDKKTVGEKNKFKNPGRNRDKDKSMNSDEKSIKHKKGNKYDEDITTKRNKMKKGHIEKEPIEGFADDPQPDFKEVRPESIKAKTGRLDEPEPKGKGRKTTKFTMKGTNLPKRDFYKLSSPDYYKNLPRIVEKYDFEEPLPERDRERDRVGFLKREPSRVNKKVKLPKYEKTYKL